MTELCDLCERCGDCMVPTLLEGISLASCENFVANEIDDDYDEFQGSTDLPGAKYKIGDTLRIVEVFERNLSTEERRKLKGYEFKVGYIDQYSTGEFVYSTGDEAEHDIEYVFYEDEVELVENKEIIDLQSIFSKYLNDSKEDALRKAEEISERWKFKDVPTGLDEFKYTVSGVIDKVHETQSKQDECIKEEEENRNPCNKCEDGDVYFCKSKEEQAMEDFEFIKNATLDSENNDLRKQIIGYETKLLNQKMNTLQYQVLNLHRECRDGFKFYIDYLKETKDKEGFDFASEKVREIIQIVDKLEVFMKQFYE